MEDTRNEGAKYKKKLKKRDLDAGVEDTGDELKVLAKGFVRGKRVRLQQPLAVDVADGAKKEKKKNLITVH